MSSVEHPWIRPGILEERLYQQNISGVAADHNTLVVLPTGLGKTAIALRVAAEFLRREPRRSILFMAPTRPLVVQHARSVEATLLGPTPLVLTGTISPERRIELLRPPQIVVATPQVIANDLVAGALNLDPFSLIIFDEAHRAVGDYPYVRLGRENQRTTRARVLAMTASPGSAIERVRAIWSNLGIERFEYRTAFDGDVQPYAHGIGVETVEVQVPVEVQRLVIHIRTAIRRQMEILRTYGLVADGEANRRDLLTVGDRLHREVEVARRRGESAPAQVWAATTAHSVAMKALHALELAESQGVESLRKFLAQQAVAKKSRLTPAQRTFLADPDITAVLTQLADLDVEHPKVAKAVQIVTEELHAAPASRVLVFAQYRQTAEMLAAELAALNDPAVRAARFVGQASRGEDVGLRQHEQVELLDRFRSGAINCLVATSVAEEGLDIPSTDLVVFYEPVPDAIRTIQRRGRTGRVRAGRAIVLVATGTRDVGVQRSARSRERRMLELLERVQREAGEGRLPAEPPAHAIQTSLSEFGSQ
ncbi:MAG: DEAD/DEAH box helicase [Thermoplasmata archaeon]|nr:DEAD/DEAH box helicase [Thermoplasmata archaeon]